MKWTNKRVQQLKLLNDLVMDIEILDLDRNFLANTQKCIENANLLMEIDWNNMDGNFLEFLNGLCNAERKSRKKKIKKVTQKG